MASFSLAQWLEQIDPSMKQYAIKLESFGFGSLKTLRNIDNDDISNYFPEMLPGHKKALLGEASKLRTPVKVNEATSNVSNEQPGTKKRQRQIDFVNVNSSNHNNSISVHVNTNDVSGKAETASNAKKSRSEKQCNNEFPGLATKTMSDREENLVIRLSRLEAEISEKTEEINCYMLPVQSLPNMGSMTSICSNCHRKGHRADGNKGKKDCMLEKCESYFICGQKSKHPEYGRQLGEKKKELNNLKESVRQIHEQLDMLRKFVEKTRETNFMLDIKRRLRITDPKKYRDVSVLLRDTRTLKVAYKGKVPPVDQNDSEEFPRLIQQMRHKVKHETGDFSFPCDDEDTDDDNFGDENVYEKCINTTATNSHQTQMQMSNGANVHTFRGPSLNDSSILSTMPFPWPMAMQQPNQWLPQPLPYIYPSNLAPAAAVSTIPIDMTTYQQGENFVNTDSTCVPNSANTDVNNFVGEISDIDLPLLPDLEKYLGL